jgi:hypothetical protein
MKPFTFVVGAVALFFSATASAQTTDSTKARPDTAARPQPAVPQTRAPATYMNIGFVGMVDAGWSSARDVRALQPGDHDPHVRGFTIPNVELTLDGAVGSLLQGLRQHRLQDR